MNVSIFRPIPHLPATPDGAGRWRVFCRHCRRIHVHGGVGRRHDHCQRAGSPYRWTGYVVDPGGNTTVPCPRHPSADIATVEDSNGWTAFQCELGCWLGSIATP